jgi:quinate dehydrogenase
LAQGSHIVCVIILLPRYAEIIPILALGPVIHNFIAKAIHLPWHFGLADTADIGAFVAQVRRPNWAGAVVTLPHKRTVIPFLDEVDDHVRALRACNGVWKRPDGSLVGTNTDWQGIYGSLVATTENGRGKPALIIGAGGASRAAVYAAKKLDCPIVYIVRSSVHCIICFLITACGR